MKTFRKILILLQFITFIFIFTACQSKESTPVSTFDPNNGYVTESSVCDYDIASYDTILDNPYSQLSVPTCITKLGDLYFIVDCYHNQVLYHDNLSDPIYRWQVMTSDINMGHTVASDGQVYLIDDTENNRILVMEKITNRNNMECFALTQMFPNIGTRPHYIVYNKEDDTFYAWSSMTGEMYLFRRSDNENRVYLTEIKSIPELDGFYVRSFTIEDDSIFFVSGNLNIIEADLNTFKIKKRYPVASDIAGMVQLTHIDDYYYITVSTDAYADQSKATIIRTRDLNSLANNEYEDIYENFIGGGTPYCIYEIDNTFYLCEHRLPAHAIWKFNIKNNEICDVETLY